MNAEALSSLMHSFYRPMASLDRFGIGSTRCAVGLSFAIHLGRHDVMAAINLFFGSTRRSSSTLLRVAIAGARCRTSIRFGCVVDDVK